MATARYYRFTPCCVGAHPSFFLVPTTELPFLPKVYSYSGPTITDSMGYSLEAGKCYYVEEFLSADLPWVASLFPCPEPDPVTLLPFIETSIEGDCKDMEPTVECPCTIPENNNYVSYSLQSCCGGSPSTIYLVDDTLVEGGTYIYTSAAPYAGLVPTTCYTATRISYTGTGVPPYAQGLFADFTLVEEGCGDGSFSSICEYTCLECICTRFQWTGTLSPGTYEITYIDCNNQIATIFIPTDGSWSAKVCLKRVLSTCPNPSICWTTQSFGDCTLNIDTYECPQCYELIDCAGIKDNIYTLNSQVDIYVDTQQVIQIAGDDTCWTVHRTDNDCECAIEVTVQFVFNTCKTCMYPKGYMLTECTTGAIQYTTTDLSDYTTVIIKTDCGGCWTVTELDIIPPSSQPVNVLAGFETCEICNSTFYLLTDCLGILDPIVTITDLSDYVGEVIELKYCPQTCWTVEITDPQEISGEVIVESSFGIRCSECLVALLTPQCATFTNTNNTVGTVEYVDLEGQSGLRIILQGGETSDKACYLYWSARPEITVTEYGVCVDGLCPAPPSPLIYRTVTPGYNTASCSPAYYEKVECTYSELLYKDVLEERYGIANCCPEEMNDWEIKHELLMLQVLVDPNYTCSTASACGCPSNCDCGYISDKIIYSTCATPAPVPSVTCVNYSVFIKVVVGGTVLHYKDCTGKNVAKVIPPNKVKIEYLICGIVGQTAADIYCEFPVQEFSFTESTTPC